MGQPPGVSATAPRALTWVGSLRAAHRDMFKVALKGAGRFGQMKSIVHVQKSVSLGRAVSEISRGRVSPSRRAAHVRLGPASFVSLLGPADQTCGCIGRVHSGRRRRRGAGVLCD